MNLTVLGAGAWGTALAVQASARQPTRLWARDAAQAAQMRSLRRNARYLPEIALPPALQVTADFGAALAHARDGLVIVATPIDLRRIVQINRPSQRVRYELQEIGQPTLLDLLRERFGEKSGQPSAVSPQRTKAAVRDSGDGAES